MTDKNKNKTIKTILIALGYFAVIFFIFFFIFKKQEPVQENIEKFSKGVLAINTNKSSYKTNEKVEFGLASLDSNGDTLCDSNLEIIIKEPDGKETILTSKDGEILKMNSCDENNNVTSNPDYTAYFFPAEEGVYKVKLTNLENGNEKETQFEVKKDFDFSIERDGATRINPFATDRYHMILKVTAKKDFKGKIIEKLPASFNIVWQGKSIVETEGNIKKITWEIDLKAGETKELIYEYQAPKNSPDFYELGKATVFENEKSVFEEVRFWQVASDPIEYVGSAFSDTKSRSHNCAVPTGTEQYDIIFAEVTVNGTTVSSVPTGWSTIGSYTSSTDRYYLYYKIAGSSEPATYAWGTAGNIYTGITTVTYRGGFDLSDPVDILSNTAYRTSGTDVRAASMSVTYPSSPLLFFGAVYSTTSHTFTKPSVPTTDWVEDVDYYGGDSDFGRTVDSMTWSGSGATGTIIANASVSTTTKHAFTVALNPPITNVTGTVYTNEAKSSNIGSGKTVSLYVNNTYKGSDDTDANGYYSFSNIIGVGLGDVLVAYLDDETENGSTVTTIFGLDDITADIITDRVILQHETNGSSVTNEDLDRMDGVDATNEDGITVSSGVATIADGFELLIPSGEIYAPGDDVNTPKLHIKGTYSGAYEKLTLTGSGTGACDASASSTRPLCIDSGGVYNYNSNSTSYSGNGNSYILGGSYSNLFMQPTITDNVTYTFTGSATITGDFTIEPTSTSSYTLTVNMAGDITVNFPGSTTVSGITSALSVLDTISGSNYSLTSGFLTIRAAGTLEARDSTITLTGSNYSASETYVASGQWTGPQGVSTAIVRARAGGGGGGGGSSAGGGGGGGGGEYRQSTISVTSGYSYTITVGKGGSAGYGSANGGDGGDSSFNSLVLAYGGNGGLSQANGATGGTGGSGGTGTIGYAGGNGDLGSSQTGGGGGEGAGSTADGGDASGQTAGTGTDGGDGGTGGARNGNGLPGNIPGGAGGGGGRNGGTGAKGAAGLVLIEFSSVDYVFTRVGTFNQGTSNVIFTQTRGDANLTDGTITFYDFEINMAGYTGTLGDPITVQNDMDITTGTLDDGGNQISGNSTGTLTAASGAILSLGGTTSGTSFPTLFTNANIALNIDSTVIYNAGVSQYISGTPTYGNIIIYSDGIISDSTINVHGDWTCYGDITPGTSTVYLNGSGTQTVTGETNFYNLDITTATAKTITFTQDAIVNILSGGNVTFEGVSGNLLTLTSSSLAPWYLRLDPAATYSISYVNVSESNAGGYQTIYANDGTVTNGGLNINWIFATPGTQILMNFNGVNLSGVDIN